jgi:hypothetical protein
MLNKLKTRRRNRRLAREVRALAPADFDQTSHGYPVTVDLLDGYSVRARTEPDYDHSVTDDGDWYGRLEWSDRVHSDRGGRPDDFDGNAEIIDRDRSDRLWWQPPADVKRGTEQFDSLRRSLLDAYHYGYDVVFVELLGPDQDAYGHRAVLDWFCIGAVQSIRDDAYTADVVGDLLADLAHSVGHSAE